MLFSDQSANAPSNQVPSHMIQQAPPPQVTEESSDAMNVLAARYNSVAMSSQFQQQLQQQQVRQRQQFPDRERNANYFDMMSEQKQSVKIGSQQEHGKEKVRTQEEQADGRMLLGFLQELQSNHQKAAKAFSKQTTQGSVTTVPQLQSTCASMDGTATPGGSYKRSLLKRGFDISVKKDSDMETASSMSGFAGSAPKSDAFSGSSSGGNESSSSDDFKDQSGFSGDEVRAGPLRKRFRREEKVASRDDMYSDTLNKRD